MVSGTFISEVREFSSWSRVSGASVRESIPGFVVSGSSVIEGRVCLLVSFDFFRVVPICTIPISAEEKSYWSSLAF